MVQLAILVLLVQSSPKRRVDKGSYFNKMGHSDYRRKVIELDVAHDLGLRSKEFRSIVKKLDLCTVPLTDEEVLAVIKNEKAVVRKDDPLKAEIKSNQVKASIERGVCPVPGCGVAGEPIELLGNKRAFYCAEHRAVIPAIKPPKE